MFSNCIGCALTNHCQIYIEWRELTGIGFQNNKVDELIVLVKLILGMFNIVSGFDLKNKENQEQFRGEIMDLQDKLTKLKDNKKWSR